MDPQKPQHSYPTPDDPGESDTAPSTDIGRSDAVSLRSATPSESSPSKPLPELEALALPDWDGNQDAVSWFVQFRKVLKSIIYRYCGAIQKALHIFEENNATHYTRYDCLTQFLRRTWIRWKEFSDTKVITTKFLTTSVIYEDLLHPIRWMITPLKAAKRFAQEMAQLRDTTRQVATELFSNRGLIEDAMARLTEANEGHDISPFSDSPTQDQGDVPTEKLEKVSLTDPEHESSSSEGEDSDSDEEVIGFGRIKDHNLLEENGFEPIWIQGFGYPGTPPPELQEYLSSESTRKYYLAISGVLPCSDSSDGIKQVFAI